MVAAAGCRGSDTARSAMKRKMRRPELKLMELRNVTLER